MIKHVDNAKSNNNNKKCTFLEFQIEIKSLNLTLIKIINKIDSINQFIYNGSICSDP